MNPITKTLTATPRTNISSWLWVLAPLIGAIFGVLAQLLRQVPGALMNLGASTAPWVMVGFLLAVSVSQRARTPRKAIFIATGIVSTYLLAWILLYHLLFALRESVSLTAGWRQAAPWLISTIPASPFLGTIAALSHKRGILGDTCIALSIAWSLPELLDSLKKGWGVGTVFIMPIVLFTALLILVVKKERRISAITLLAATVALGILGFILFPIYGLLLGRF